MKVSFYCQHVLGIGHFHRSLELCKELALRHRTTLILGGPPVVVDNPNITVLALPGLEMDEEFLSLVPCQAGRSLGEVKEERRLLLSEHLEHNRPDILITELYPFGRKAFKFELDPLLAELRTPSSPKCLCCCSVRDILVEKKEGREKFERRVVQTLNTSFDGILIHADPDVIRLSATFDLLDKIHIPMHYTGFVAKAKSAGNSQAIRKSMGLAAKDKLIVASIGGGNVGSELLQAVVLAFSRLNCKNVHLQIFSGPYCDAESYRTLSAKRIENMTVSRFTDRFPDWLEAADLSISMAGYNTCMNLLQAGIPALVYPYKQNREQRLRAEKLGEKAPIVVLSEGDLDADCLARHMDAQLTKPRATNIIDINGAIESVKQLEHWYSEKYCHD
jgi:predicted glycosyltransferase